MKYIILILLLISVPVFAEEMPETFGFSYFLFYEKGEETITPSNFFAPVIGDTTLYGGSAAFNFLQFGHKVFDIDFLHGQRLEIKRSMLREEFEGYLGLQFEGCNKFHSIAKMLMGVEDDEIEFTYTYNDCRCEFAGESFTWKEKTSDRS
jgi:hypothetical protein